MEEIGKPERVSDMGDKISDRVRYILIGIITALICGTLIYAASFH
jgi:hypothetical protein